MISPKAVTSRTTSASSVTSPREFFAFEKDLIEELLIQAAVIRRCDEKLITFLVDVIEPLIAQSKKLVIFTEYRATQTYLAGGTGGAFSRGRRDNLDQRLNEP